MTSTMTEQLTGRSLVSETLFERLVARLVSEEDTPRRSPLA